MTDAFGVSKALADTPKVFQPLLRYGNQVARTGGSGSRMGNAVRQRLALKATAGQPAASSRAAFDGINAAMKAPKAAPSNAGMDALSRGMAGATAPKPAPVPSQGAVDAGNQAARDASRAVKDRSARNRKLKIAGYTGAAAVGSGGAVLGADALNDRRKSRKSTRAQLAG